MYFVRLVLLGVILYTSCFVRPSLAQDNQLSEQQKQVYELIVSSLRAGFEKGDLATYMKIWAPEAKIISARSLTDDSHNVVITRAQNEQTKRILFSMEQTLQMKPKVRSVEINKDSAVVFLTVELHYLQQPFVQTVGERYLLQKTDNNWRITENRWWVEKDNYDGKVQVHSPQFYQQIDSEIAKLPKNTGIMDRVRLLYLARRAQQAFTELEAHIYALPNPSSALWYQLGWTATWVGNAQVSVEAFRKAHALDPNLLIPKTALP